MFFTWNSNIVHLTKEQSWHLEFSDFENMRQFKLKLFVAPPIEEDYCIAVEDGSSFKQFDSDSYPYFLFDYCNDVVLEISQEIKTGNDIIDIEEIFKRVKSKWKVFDTDTN